MNYMAPYNEMIFRYLSAETIAYNQTGVNR